MSSSVKNLCALFPWLAFALFSPEPALSVEQWEVHECALTTSKQYANPWLDVSLSATFTHRRTGTMLHVPGFYDGDGKGGQKGKVWKLRFMPTSVGTWRFTTKSNDAHLNGVSGSITVTPPTAGNHGPVTQHPTEPNHYAYADGTEFILLGDDEHYEKFLKSLAKGDGRAEKQAEYDRKHHINTRTTHSHNRYAPPEYGSAFVGGVNGDYRQMNMTYWKNLDRAMRFFQRHGYQIVHSFLSWNENKQYDHEDVFDEYFSYGIARLWAYRCVMSYNLGGEVDEHKTKDWAEKWMKFIHQSDPLGRKVVVHHTRYWHWYGPKGQDWWMGVWAQLWKSPDDLNAEVLRIRSETDKPVWIQEYIYLPGRGGPTAARQKTWAMYLAGAYGSGASTADIFPWSSDWIPEVGRMMDILRESDYPHLQPHNELITSGGKGKYCMADPGNQYIIYSLEGSSIELDLRQYPRTFTVRWYDPVRGTHKPPASVRGGRRVRLHSPFGEAEAAVIVRH